MSSKVKYTNDPTKCQLVLESISSFPNDSIPSFNDINKLKPNKSGLYGFCFHSSCRQPPLCDETEIRNLFSPVVPIRYFYKHKGLQFIYFTRKELAIKVWRAFQRKLKLRLVDHQEDCIPKKPNSTDTKKIKMTNQKYSHHSTGNDSSKGVVLFMGNLAMNSTQQQIQEFMSEIQILELKILKTDNKCYAFLRVFTQAEADRAVKMFHNRLFKDRYITLKLFQSLDHELQSPTDDAKALTLKGLNINNRSSSINKNNNNNNKNDRRNPSINCKQNYDYLKARMPPLENMVSDDDDDADVSCFEKTFNEDTRSGDVTSSFHLLVGNFPYGTSEADLMKLFWPYHPIEVMIVNTNDRSRSTQSFVCFSNANDLDNAIEEIDLSEYKKHILLATSAICCENTRKDEHL